MLRFTATDDISDDVLNSHFNDYLERGPFYLFFFI